MKVQPFQNLFQPGSAGSLLTIGTGPWGAAHSIGVTNASMANLSCDAYVVPQPTSAVYYPAKIARSGAFPGLRSYADHVGSLEVPRDNGDVFIAESGGGNSIHLLNVVSTGGETMFEQIEDLMVATRAALSAAHGISAYRVAFPAMGVAELGGITSVTSARVMLGTIHEYWKEFPGEGPHEVVFAIDGGFDVFRAFDAAHGEMFVDSNGSASVVTGGNGRLSILLRILVENLTDDGRARRNVRRGLGSTFIDASAMEAALVLSSMQPEMFDDGSMEVLAQLAHDSRAPISSSAFMTLENLFGSNGNSTGGAGRHFASAGMVIGAKRAAVARNGHAASQPKTGPGTPAG